MGERAPLSRKGREAAARAAPPKALLAALVRLVGRLIVLGAVGGGALGRLVAARGGRFLGGRDGVGIGGLGTGLGRRRRIVGRVGGGVVGRRGAVAAGERDQGDARDNGDQKPHDKPRNWEEGDRLAQRPAGGKMLRP